MENKRGGMNAESSSPGRRRGWPRLGLFPKLLFSFWLLSLTPLIVLGARVSLLGRSVVQGLVMDQLEVEGAKLAEQVREFLLERERDLNTLAAGSLTEAEAAAFVAEHRGQVWRRVGVGKEWRETRESLPLYAEAALIDPSGKERWRIAGGEPVPRAALRDVSNPANTTYLREDYFAATLQLPPGDMYVSHLTGWYVTQKAQLAGAQRIEDAVEGQRYHGVIRFATRVVTPAGKLRGVLMLSLDHVHLMELTQHVVPLSRERVVFPDYAGGNYAYMFDDEGWFITHPKLWNLRGLDAAGNLVPAYTPDAPAYLVEGGTMPLNLTRMAWNAPWYDDIMPTVRQGKSLRNVAPNVGYSGARPVLRARVYVPIPYDRGPYKRYGIFGGIAIGAEIGLAQELSDAFAGSLLYVALGAGLLVVAAAVALSRGIARPILRLRDAARRVAAGDLSTRIEAGGNDEVGDLARAFSEMLDALRESRRRLREAERFASIGAVISGTAHAIKTELNIYGLVNNVSLLERQLPPDDPRRKLVDAIKRGVEDLEAMVSRLLVPTPQFEAPCAPARLVEDALELYRRAARKRGIEVTVEIDPATPHVAVDRRMFSRALMNLFDNAMDAMTDGGRLMVRVYPQPAAAGEGVNAAVPMVCIEVSDTGPGIPDAVRDKMFFPFFTTKRERGGSGLGLYQSLRIVSDHGGTLDLVDRKGFGTTIRVLVPAETRDGVE